MLVDALQLADGSQIDTDVCIVGAGPAGITVAVELMKHRDIGICLVESGGFDFEPETQALSDLGVADCDLEPPHGARRRQFGGAANAWDVRTTPAGKGVRLLPLSEIDFEKRDRIPHSGWPFTRADLQRYYERAQDVFGIGPYKYQADDWAEPNAPAWQVSPEVRTSIEQFAHSGRFTRDHRSALGNSGNVSLLLHANVTSLSMSAGSSAVDQVNVQCLNGYRHSVKARMFVLACGGIENPRLMLMSRESRPAGIGNQNGIVGRYFTDHNLVHIGRLIPDSAGLLEKAALYDLRLVRGTWIMAKLNLAEELLRQEGLLNSGGRINPSERPGFAQAWSALRRLGGSVRRREIPSGLASTARQVLPEVPRLALVGAAGLTTHGATLFSRRGKRGKYGWSENAAKRLRYEGFRLELQIELAPDPENRVLLSEERDRFGRPLAAVRWNWTQLDLASLRRTQELFAEAFRQSRLGRFEMAGRTSPPQAEHPDGMYHHIGTTRIHASPKQGVVDADCRVHHVDNLFVAGSSVFPTGGYANPTLTIAALSIRLAEHLERVLRLPAGEASRQMRAGAFPMSGD